MPFGSQHRNERISAVALELSEGEYDVAILQEVILLMSSSYYLAFPVSKVKQTV